MTVLLNLGVLNKKIDIINGVAGEYKDFETINDNILYKNIWAAIQPLRGKEYLELKKVSSEETVKIIIRYRGDVNEGCKIRYRKHIYEVVAVIDPDMSHETLELRCVERKRGNTPTGLRTSEAWVP